MILGILTNSKFICLTEKVQTQMENVQQYQTSLLINKFIQDTTQVCKTPEQNLHGTELSNAMSDTSAFCQLCGFANEQDMVVGLAFTTPFEAKQFTLFAYILHVDATADTNKETFSLVIIAWKDSYGRMYVILCAFLPCEKG